MRQFFLRANPKEFFDILIASLPRRIKKCLGKPNLQPADLLNEPRAPKNFPHRGSYMNVPRESTANNIIKKSSVVFLRPELVKGIISTNSSTVEAIETKVYVGSSVALRGLADRLSMHETIANKFKNYSRQSDTINFLSEKIQFHSLEF